MVTIDSETKTIYATRGDELEIYLSVPFLNDENEETSYTFVAGQKITLGVYKKGGFSKAALLFKEFTVNEVSTECRLYLTSNEMKFDRIYNKPIDYWYEITLDDDITLLGYDEDGPKILTIYPEGRRE